MAEEIIRKHIVFYGDVQGVGFRYRASHLAGSLGLTGWVRNNYDGSVEMEVQGRMSDIDALVSKLQMSPFINITHMNVAGMPVLETDRGFYVEDRY